MTRLPSLGPRGEGWVVLQFALLAVVAASGFIEQDTPEGLFAVVLTVVGWAFLLGGGALLVRGLVDLGRNLTPVPRPRDDADHVVGGVYASVRHPIYGGIVVMAFGWALVAASPLTLMLAVASLVFFELKSRREEAWLVERFAGYAAYAADTRRFIPRLY